MTQHFKDLLKSAYDAGRFNQTPELEYDFGPYNNDTDYIDTMPETHVITIHRNSFCGNCANPLIAMSVFESMSNGTGHINNDHEIGWDFPIEISQEYVQTVLTKWGCKF